MIIYFLLQKKALFIFDPKALQHVVLKDQDAFEESMDVVAYVPSLPINTWQGKLIVTFPHK